MPTYATWPAFFTALIAKKVHLGETKAVKHRGHAASSSGGVVPHYHAHAQQLIDESSSSDIDSVDLKPEGRIGSFDAEMSAMILQNRDALQRRRNLNPSFKAALSRMRRMVTVPSS